MKPLIRHSLFIILAALACFTPRAEAQLRGIFSPETLIDGGTNNILQLATNTYTSVLTVQDQNDVAIQIQGTLIVSNFCKPRIDLMESVDGSTWISTNFTSVTCLGGLSTNNLSDGMFCYTTNIHCNGIKSFKMFRIANTDYHGIMTNVTVKYTIKR